MEDRRPSSREGSRSRASSTTSTPPDVLPRPRKLSKHALEAARIVHMGLGRPEEGGVKGRVASWEERGRRTSASSVGSTRSRQASTAMHNNGEAVTEEEQGADRSPSSNGKGPDILIEPPTVDRSARTGPPPASSSSSSSEASPSRNVAKVDPLPPAREAESEPEPEPEPELEEGELVEPATPARSVLASIPESSPDSVRKPAPSAPSPLLLSASAPRPSFSGSPPSSSDSALPTSESSALSLLVQTIPSLPVAEQRALNRTLLTISTFPSPASVTLPLHRSWTLFFSDTSATAAQSKVVASSRKGAAAVTEDYESAMAEVFTVRDVPSLCGGLKAFKAAVAKAVREGRMGASGGRDWAKKKGGGGAGGEDPAAVESPGMGLGLLAMRPGQNLHFFREGVRPMWEDPWNAKGGRITISPSLAMLDQTYESLVLLVAGGVLDLDSSQPSEQPFSPGTVCGVVGNRRLRGDRVELWLSGKDVGSPPEDAWVKRVQAVVAQEVGTPDAKAARFKRHFAG